MARKFLRTGTARYKRLGSSRRKNKQRWRKARGRHNKIRECNKGRRVKVKVGYRKEREERGKIRGKKVVLIRNLKQLQTLEKGSLAVLSKFGGKKRQEILKKAGEKGINILNLRKK